MARHVFFSFHHRRDNWRANQVRNSWVTQDREAAGFWDAAEWEEVQRKDTSAVHRWIDAQMEGTSVTVVLIGKETSTRPHVTYEINQSHRLGKGIIGVKIHNLKNRESQVDFAGFNPLDYCSAPQLFGPSKAFSSIYTTYDYVTQDGYNNLGNWIEAAARQAGR